MTAPEEKNWAAVGEAVRDRMRELNFSLAQVARETGLSGTTIRYIGQPNTTRSKSVLVALSAGLRWRHDHLTNILAGYPGRNAQELTGALLVALSEEVGKLKTDLRAVEMLVDRLRNEYTE
jgi:hypothetical protein